MRWILILIASVALFAGCRSTYEILGQNKPILKATATYHTAPTDEPTAR